MSSTEQDFDYRDLPKEIQDLLDAVSYHVRSAFKESQSRNHGLSEESMAEALRLLPQDNGLYNTWPAAEEAVREAKAERGRRERARNAGGASG